MSHKIKLRIKQNYPTNVSYQRSAISYQLSAISDQLSAISYQLKAYGLWPHYCSRSEWLTADC
ncbi:hypothetical protein [Moorena sp. SIO3B2]|uniref:hypothetical protein n=1 Tax=Moorena sp. SIO3B2 TaxID=2607827 RepID=UPI0013C6C6FD|nr:hypothetical protein [Moorena sp. SIO3B2]NEP31302.1 hypothetical protein [Moorena sp. SIO3B2]